MDEMLRLAEQQPQIGTLCWAIYWASFRCVSERDFERTGAFADRAIALATEHGIGYWMAVSRLTQGTASVIADPGRTISLIDTTLREIEGSRMLLYHATFLCFEAEALLRQGQVAEARGLVDRALAMSASTGLSWWDAEVHRIRAAVIRAEGGSETEGHVNFRNGWETAIQAQEFRNKS